MDSFRIWYFIFLLILIAFAAWIGHISPKHSWSAILIDNRNRYSLTHFQVVMWTMLILSSLLSILATKGIDPANLKIPYQLLALMGIAVGSGAISTGVKGLKDSDPKRKTMLQAQSNGSERKISQIWLEEEGKSANQVINIAKYQNFIFTLVAAAYYIVMTFSSRGFPELPNDLVWLIGISHSGYIAGKIPNRE